jgi:hypothetical protein
MISREGKSPEEKTRMKRPRMKGNNEMLNLCAKISVTVTLMHIYVSDVKCNHLCMQNLSIKISIDQGVRDAR